MRDIEGSELILIITTMRVSQDHTQIKQELSKFINLLQTDFKQNPTLTLPDNKRNSDASLSKKLSIIFSASEPESSSLDKENSNPSANRSFQTPDKPIETLTREGLINTLMSANLTQPQLKIVQKLRDYIQELKVENERINSQLNEAKLQLCQQKKANDEVLNVLVTLDEQQKQLYNNYNLMTGKYQEVQDQKQLLQKELQKVKDSMIHLQKDNDFMKKLIYHANQNYEALQRKCNQLQISRQRGQITDRTSAKKSSMDNLLKSARTKKNTYSPSHSQLGRTPSPEHFQEIYRKMIIRTLKFKGKNGH